MSTAQHLLLSLLLGCVMLQALIPNGYMPGNLSAGEGAFVFCGLDIDLDHDQDDSQDSHFESGASSLCSYAGASTALAYAIPAATGLPGLERSAPFFGYDPPTRANHPSFSLPQLRAPPVPFS